MKEIFAKLVTGNFGRIKIAITALAVSAIATLATRFNVALTAEQQTTVASFVALAVAYGLEALAARMGVQSIKDIQAMLPANVKEDGYAGPVTMAAMEDLKIDAGQPLPIVQAGKNVIVP